MERIQIAVPSLGEEELQAIKGPISSGWLTQGPKVREFEEDFARMHKVEYALATTSCTTALHLMLAAYGIGPGDEVIVPSFTWIATANAVLYCGATPVLVDVDLETFNISLADTLKKITPKTKAIVVVHLFGLCVDVDEFRKQIPENIAIFEDAACAAGASVNGKMAGSMGLAAAFSFHPRKSITTGEGGMLTTRNFELAKKSEKLRNHGAEISEEERHNGSSPYLLPEFNLLGFNYRMTDLQGAIGGQQLKKLSQFIIERNIQAQNYRNELSHIPWLELPENPNSGTHAWQAFVVRVVHKRAHEFRNRVMEQLETLGISTRPGTHAIHMLGYYKSLGNYASKDFPNSLQAAQTSMAIPLHNKLTDEDQIRVIEALNECRP